MSSRSRREPHAQDWALLLVLAAAIAVAVVVAAVAAEGGARRAAAQAAHSDGGEGARRRGRSPRSRAHGRRASVLSLPSASPSRPARRSPSSAAASRRARSKGTSSSRARPTSAGPPRRSGPTARPSSCRTRPDRAPPGPTPVILNAVTRSVVARRLAGPAAGRALRDAVQRGEDRRRILANIATPATAAGSARSWRLRSSPTASMPSEHALRTSPFQILHALGDQFESAYGSTAPSASTARSTSLWRRWARTRRIGSSRTCAAILRSTSVVLSVSNASALARSPHCRRLDLRRPGQDHRPERGHARRSRTCRPATSRPSSRTTTTRSTT